MSYLPSTTYTAPTRLGRNRPLKTISETEECTFALKSDSEGDESDRTIIARPAGLDAKLATVAASRGRLSTSTCHASPLTVESSPCSTSSVEDAFQRASGRISYADSDAGTVFSEDSCPSLAGSNDTTFYTNSSRNSVASMQSRRSSRNRYPSILIPRGSWHEENSIKEAALAMSPAQKIMLSPQALSALPQQMPALTAPPSFGDGSSIASSSPCVPAVSSAPITPELQNLAPVNGETWGTGANEELAIAMPIEIAIDDDHSILISPQETRSLRNSIGYSTDWSDMVVRFPTIPGATPQENTPIEPDCSDLRGFRAQASDNGVQLPHDAMNLLHNLTRSYSPVSESRQSCTTAGKLEMKERSDNGDTTRDIVAATPTLSDYSFSQLSIPSPGGFFSSLQANSRATWSISFQPKVPSMPSSAIAEGFYDLPFKRASQTVETILEVPDRENTDGPPTARQHGFGVPAEYQVESQEDDDLYGAPERALKSSPGFEYEATYEEELKNAAGAYIDRTNDWLSAQTAYLSALRETNPLNNPADYIPQTPHPLHDHEHAELEKSCASKAVQFLESATKAADGGATSHSKRLLKQQFKDSIFLEAFEHWILQRGRQDTFLQASTRLESINSSRLTRPLRHVQSLLNACSSEALQAHSRPKYRGPFSQNPRATGQFSRTHEQALFADAERKQLAMEHILPTMWTIEAQRKVLHNGRLLACPDAARRIAHSTKKSLRILDLAGAATASWAWAAAYKWPHVKVVTVQSATQSKSLQRWQLDEKADGSKSVVETPVNHTVVTTPEIWKLPFKDNHFDIISARTLHMFLRSRPVLEVPSINEWDLTLKECMRVLRPGGVLDFIVLDSHISNNSSDSHSKHSRENSSEASISPNAIFGQGFMSPPPTATFGANATPDPLTLNFSRTLKNHGYDADGGCSKLADRLMKQGFIDIKRQWVGLPVGRTESSHDNVTASYESFDAANVAAAKAHTAQASLQRSKVGSISHANGRSRTPFPPAPRPISEVSSISRIIEQYSNVEAVHGPVGSTADVSDMAGLLGGLMWEEWLVRHRLEALNKVNKTDEQETVNAFFEAENLLHGVNDVLAAGYSKGACFRAVVGWARKPGRSTASKKIAIDTNTETYRARAAQRAASNPSFEGYPFDETPITAATATSSANRYYGRGFTSQTPVDQMRRDLTVDTRASSGGSHGSPFSYTQSAVERGEVGTIPMMIVE